MGLFLEKEKFIPFNKMNVKNHKLKKNGDKMSYAFRLRIIRSDFFPFVMVQCGERKDLSE